MPDPVKLKKLVNLRRAAGKSQAEAAVYFGLAPSARNEIRLWEYGEKIPPPKYRTLFIGYVWDFLNLRQDPEQFEAVWAVMVEEWGWDPPTEIERQKYLVGRELYTPPESQSTAHFRELQAEDRMRPDMDKSQRDSPVEINGNAVPREKLIRSALILASIIFLGILMIIGFIGGFGNLIPTLTPTVTASSTPTITPTFTPIPTLTTTPTPVVFSPPGGRTGHYSFVGQNCPEFEHPMEQEKTVLRVCAWVNIDYDNHRVRGWGNVQWKAGPKPETINSTLRLKKDDEIVYLVQSSSTGDLPEIKTELLICEEWQVVTSEMEVVVTYVDGQREQIFARSDHIKPEC